MAIPITTPIPTAFVALTPLTAPSANTAQTFTLDAVEGKCWHLAKIDWGYDANPTGGKVTISWTVGVNTFTITIPITNGGAGFTEWKPITLRFPANTSVTIALAAGGAGVKGYLYPHAATVAE